MRMNLLWKRITCCCGVLFIWCAVVLFTVYGIYVCHAVINCSVTVDQLLCGYLFDWQIVFGLTIFLTVVVVVAVVMSVSAGLYRGHTYLGL